MLDNGIFDNNVEDVSHLACISIISSNMPNHSYWFKSDHSNVLNLKFDDADEKNVEQYKNTSQTIRLFQDSDAFKVIDFALTNTGRYFYIHCIAGVSRSGAVGFFIRQLLDYDYEQFRRMNTGIIPNSYVLQKLVDVYSKNYV